jgi:creatinine amidohydrolase
MAEYLRLAEMTVEDVIKYLKVNKTIILPYGLSEQHGYHLPLNTDILNAEILGAKLAGKLGCIVAPTLNYCFSGGMLPGTINVKPNTFSQMVCDIIESLSVQGFENIIIVPGHGGSESLIHLKESLRIAKWLNPLWRKTSIFLIQLWNYSPTWLAAFKSQDYHAGEIETSLIMHWRPEVVRKKIVMDQKAVAEQLRGDPDSYQKRTRYSSNNEEIIMTVQDPKVKIGVMGFPERANAKLGAKVEKEILDNASVELKKAVAEASRNRKAGKENVIRDEEKLKILAL